MTGRQANLVTSGGVTVQLSHLDKVFFPDEGLHKGDLVDYYRIVAPRMLPYLRERPVVMGRYPDGVTGEAILQKNVSRHFPDWVKRVEVPRLGRGGAVCQVVCDKPETLIYLANQACIELHVLLSRVGALDRPDQLVFDLDPRSEEALDEEAFDDPERFDIGRSPNPHVTFGAGGAHFCIGANLSRLELKVMFDVLADELPNMRLKGPPSRLRSSWLNGIKHLPVDYGGFG